ncbi:hypothetical protein L1049_021302 [Liquidambar formosana]|uniref:F-box domain-containing protein n=1 Tax=Liquidambar formosana TaxID=63359 RepID=A0AAP0S9N5_LIQFO
MSNPIERYEKLGLKESLPRTYHYPLACKELSFILRNAYSKLPKNLQSLIFQDTLAAFRLLPEMQTQSAVSAANLLLQGAEAALPKQKRVLAGTEFKHAKVAHKRCSKTRQEEEGLAQLPEDVLVHIFSFLDMRSLVSVALVCWSWNSAASDYYLWQSQYFIFFGNSDNCSNVKGQQSGRLIKNREYTLLQEDIVARDRIDWRDAFRRAYIGNSLRKSSSYRGYCPHCNAIVWLSNMKCFNKHYGLKSENRQIKPVSPQQIVKYLLDGSLSMISSSDSDSDSDSDGGSFSKLWAYPRDLSGCHMKTFS